MSEIVISQKEEMNNGWEFTVRIKENDSATDHSVSLEREYYKNLTEENITPDELIQQSFRFLLERESKESIFKKFDIKVIETYFPEYRKEIKK